MATQLRFAMERDDAVRATGPQHAPRAIAFHIPATSAKPAPRRAKPKPSPWAARPPPVKRTAKPAWNDDVHGAVLFDQSLAKNQLRKDPKRTRDKAPPAMLKKVIASVYTQPKKSQPPVQQRSIVRPRPTTTAPKIKTKPALATHWSRRPVATPALPATEPEPICTIVEASPARVPSPQAAVHHIKPLDLDTQQPSPPPPSYSPNPVMRPLSPVRMSSNQEDKDDDIAYRSIPPPIIDVPQPTPIQRKLIVSTFKVLDAKRRGVLHAREIHQGLQLLGITSTLRQITDYLYLVNDGMGDTIGLSEWVILVNTLQSAEWLTADSPLQIESSDESPSPASAHSVGLSPIRHAPSPVHQAPVVATRPASPPPSTFQETWFIDQIERRNDMFSRAEASVALRWNNQQTTDEAPETFLRRAAHVVHGLKSSLYPLVHQAEETLRAIQGQHAASLSVFLSPKDMAKVTTHAEDLADLLLDDLLTDTVDVLQQHEKAQTTEVWRQSELDQLQSLLDLIESVQADEDLLLHPTPPAIATQASAISDTKSGCILPLHVLVSTTVTTDAPNGTDLTTAAPQHSMERDDSHRPTFFKTPLAGGISTAHVGRIAGALALHRTAFLRSRKVAEATLVDTGLDQPVVIELLEEMLLHEMLDDIALELDSCFGKLGEKILRTV
ncbi:hypothetical protein SPRG_13247 [Saprolegnia parasitica CBS 223.65]|uniref:EF-hand domain-containing protein n=1 Tax=Saprolegnia parasitica (strain CBS 223.65) TaxID=695850 RepID=A0A067C1W2_SAPPC|nr:hypothetical protein SPRG_13247 [Saprolegnia parasitica CBS 223.65]KDO20551.1 hypothetical protein SPRG_13247 [Saprolegnia parasitica CBS 223.65]|eukprot:XP_012208740.1 hypothetical protein SPRG_13247 [Saprolegnia parasitica CBS 223.65]